MKNIQISFVFILKWVAITLFTAISIGTATAFFLKALDFVTSWRDHHIWIVNFLPLAGLIIGLAYYYAANVITKGNNLIIEAYHNAEKEQPPSTIPFVMAPLIFISTLLTHLGGGSAGREGTAVQIGGAIADRCTQIFSLSPTQRKTILLMGVSAGFAAVFGTPWAGAVFALEMMSFQKIKFENTIPCLVAALGAHYVCLAWQVHHTIYTVNNISAISLKTIGWSFLAGVLFGLTAFLFLHTHKIFEKLFSMIKFPPLRPVLGGIVIAFCIVATRNTTFIGLGIPSIIEAFNSPAGNFDFALKILLTCFTLSAGFKGGEVTPLFFIGATLGSILISFIPLPIAMLAAMGFVAVFAGATNCVVASIIMGIEMFGIQAGFFVAIASIVAYFSSGKNSIYSAKLSWGAKLD